MTMTVTKLDSQIVKQTLSKLPLDLINRLLVDVDKNCVLLSNGDVDSPRKELSTKRKKLIEYLTESNDIDTFNKVKALADSLAEYDNKIESIKKEIEPLQNQLKVKKDRLKILAENKESFTKGKVDELDATLNEAALNKIAQYNAVVEKVAVKSQNEKQMKKTLKEVAKGFIASDIAGVTEEFGEAIFETSNVTLNFVAKMRTRIKEHEETGHNLNTVAGINTINQRFEREWSTHETNIINKTGLNPDWKQAEVLTCQSEEVVPAQKLLMPVMNAEFIVESVAAIVAA